MHVSNNYMESKRDLNDMDLNISYTFRKLFLHVSMTAVSAKLLPHNGFDQTYLHETCPR